MVQSICLFVCSNNDSGIGVCRFKGQGQCHCKEKERLLELSHLVPGLWKILDLSPKFTYLYVLYLPKIDNWYIM